MQEPPSIFGLALTRFFQEEAAMLADLMPTAAQDYLRAIWFEGKRSGWPCANGAMEELFAQFLSGKIRPTRDPQPGSVFAVIAATRSVLNAAIGPSSAAVVSERALIAALEEFPAAREPLTSALS
jgi:hypothetical protein